MDSRLSRRPSREAYSPEAYQSAGRSEDAESIYRGILDIDPLFDIDAMVVRVDEVYGVTVFDLQLIEVFRTIRRIR